MIRATISHLDQAKNKMAPNSPVLASGGSASRKEVWVHSRYSKNHLQVTGVEKLFRGKDLSLVEEFSSVTGGPLQAGLAA